MLVMVLGTVANAQTFDFACPDPSIELGEAYVRGGQVRLPYTVINGQHWNLRDLTFHNTRVNYTAHSFGATSGEVTLFGTESGDTILINGLFDHDDDPSTDNINGWLATYIYQTSNECYT